MTAVIVFLAAAGTTVGVTSILWSIAVGTVLPLLTTLITQSGASDRLKALLTAILAGVTGALAGYLTSPPAGWAQWEQILTSIAAAWGAAIITYVGFHKPTGTVAFLEQKTGRFGIGVRADAEAA